MGYMPDVLLADVLQDEEIEPMLIAGEYCLTWSKLRNRWEISHGITLVYQIEDSVAAEEQIAKKFLELARGKWVKGPVIDNTPAQWEK